MNRPTDGRARGAGSTWTRSYSRAVTASRDTREHTRRHTHLGAHVHTSRHGDGVCPPADLFRGSLGEMGPDISPHPTAPGQPRPLSSEASLRPGLLPPSAHLGGASGHLGRPPSPCKPQYQLPDPDPKRGLFFFLPRTINICSLGNGCWEGTGFGPAARMSRAVREAAGHAGEGLSGMSPRSLGPLPRALFSSFLGSACWLPSSRPSHLRPLYPQTHPWRAFPLPFTVLSPHSFPTQPGWPAPTCSLTLWTKEGIQYSRTQFQSISLDQPRRARTIPLPGQVSESRPCRSDWASEVRAMPSFVMDRAWPTVPQAVRPRGAGPWRPLPAHPSLMLNWAPKYSGRGHSRPGHHSPKRQSWAGIRGAGADYRSLGQT